MVSECQDRDCKEETFPLNELLKAELEVEEIDLMSLKKSLVANKLKKRKKVNKSHTSRYFQVYSVSVYYIV